MPSPIWRAMPTLSLKARLCGGPQRSTPTCRVTSTSRSRKPASRGPGTRGRCHGRGGRDACYTRASCPLWTPSLPPHLASVWRKGLLKTWRNHLPSPNTNSLSPTCPLFLPSLKSQESQRELWAHWSTSIRSTQERVFSLEEKVSTIPESHL